MSKRENSEIVGTRQSTGRYKVSFVSADGREEQVLVLCNPENTVGSLRDEIGRRLLKTGIPVAVSRLQLRLDSRTGPLLDEDDSIAQVLPQPATENVFALETSIAEPVAAGLKNPKDKSGSNPAEPETPALLQSEQDWTGRCHFPFKIRVLTPHLARRHKEAEEVPVIPATFSSKTTLRQLYEQVSQHLNLPTSTEADRKQQAHCECNCSLARAIQNVVEPIECASIEEAAVVRAVQARYSTKPGFDLEKKRLGFFDPVSPSASWPSGNEHAGHDTLDEVNGQDDERNKPSSTSPAIVTICSAERHQRCETTSSDDPDGVVSGPSLILDLHTAESPIKTQNLAATVGELCLAELAIDGVLTIYAVPRQIKMAAIRAPSGQEAIYLNGVHWELPTTQTQRGMAMFLSSLRMAVHLISRCGEAGKAEAYHDSALHIMHVLTRFPPAVRALHILLEGTVPAEEECAALIQACYEVIVDMMSTSVLAKDQKRTLEGSRLFFSTFLYKAKEFALHDDGGSMLPYVSSMKSVNLTNSETMEPIAFPVDTSVGLMEKGCYDALKAGIIQFTEDELNLSLDKTILDGRTKRAALLGGGALMSNTMFDMEIPHSSRRYSDNCDEDKVIHPKDLTNILQHAANAFAAKLQVVAPASLGTAPNPVLTLDRDGFLAVYLGRRPCGAPGRDFMIFRPTNGGECDIDISIVAQLLEPITAARIADGTAIFDGEFYAAQRRSDKPDEILMICVDCSSSMSESAGFDDTGIMQHDDDDDDDVPGRSEAEILLNDIRQYEMYVGSLDDMKEAFQEHESFNDMIHTVSASNRGQQRTIAAQIIKRVTGLKIMELMDKMENLKGYQRRVWRDRTGQGRQLEDAVKSLRNLIAGILAHENALSEFLIYRGCGITGPGQPNDWKWSMGDAIPTLQPNGSQRPEFPSTSLGLAVPHDLRCPMTQELFQEPVSTQDSHIYEAAAIRKWLRISQTSPLTGLRLSSAQLSPNRAMLLRASNWVDGTDVLPSTPLRRSFTRRGPTSIRVNFVSPLAQFTRVMPLTAPKSALYELAFRGMRGQYPSFSLGHDGTAIQPDAAPLATLSPIDGYRITIQLPESVNPQMATAGGVAAGSDLYLVKVYRSHASAAFSYWVRMDTQASVGSVLFKKWRHLVETSQYSIGVTDEVVWHSLKYTGDGHMSGRVSSHWDRLSTLLKPQYATGLLEPEPLYARFTDNSPGGSSEDSQENKPATSQSKGALVLKLYVHDPPRRRRVGTHTSRLSILKQMFDQFVNRILAYGYSTHLGLIKFDSTANVAQRLSPVVENFRSTVQNLQASGDTALWDALALARDQIQQYSSAYPDAKKRILCISDGVDTSSKTNKGSDLWRLLAVDDIIVDSFCLGTDDNSDLRTVSYLTSGYKFHPTSLEQAMAICEMEPVLSQLEREITNVSVSRQSQPRASRYFGIDRFSMARSAAIAEVVTQDVFPKRTEHPNLKDNFVELQAVPRRILGQGPGGPIGTSATAYMRTHRILREMQQIVAQPHPYVDVYVSERDMSFWKVVMQGPTESIYTSGTFVIYLHMDDTYPSFAPKARFVTPIYHPNVNRHGRICHSILDRNWTTDTSNSMVISTIYGLLMEPDHSDPINIVVTLDFHHDQVAFAEMARDFIQKHATRTRADWRDEILGSQVGYAEDLEGVAVT